jgi:hypothetical protein
MSCAAAAAGGTRWYQVVAVVAVGVVAVVSGGGGCRRGSRGRGHRTMVCVFDWRSSGVANGACLISQCLRRRWLMLVNVLIAIALPSQCILWPPAHSLATHTHTHTHTLTSVVMQPTNRVLRLQHAPPVGAQDAPKNPDKRCAHVTPSLHMVCWCLCRGDRGFTRSTLW